MRRVIIESPYDGATPFDVAFNIRYLAAAMRDSIARGEAPFASHGLYTLAGVLDDADPVERERGILCGYAWRHAADLTVVYQDLGISPGMQDGIEHAIKIHPVEYRVIPGWKACEI